MNNENYMNEFNSAEEFIHNEFVTNRGYNSDCFITKKEMYKLIIENNIEYKKEKPIAYIKKSELLEILMKKLSYKDLSKYVGVRGYCFMDKFDITIEELEYLSEKNIIHETNERIRVNMRNQTYKHYKLYDVYDYFNLKKENIHKYLQK